jgi:hypothetical protein
LVAFTRSIFAAGCRDFQLAKRARRYAKLPGCRVGDIVSIGTETVSHGPELLVSCEALWLGWGLPITWQGWLVFAAFFGLIVTGVLLFPPRKALATFLGYVVVLTIALIAVCWWKGEAPRWQWGPGD